VNPAVPPIAGSSAWQLAFLSFAVVILILEVLHGWRIGLTRQLMRIIAIIAAYSCAIFAGPVLLPITRSFTKLPDPILTLVGGAVLGAIIFAILNALGPLLFKRTKDHESAVRRLSWGISGGLLGILLGSFTIWLVFAGARLAGSVAEAQVRSQHAITTGILQPVWNKPLQIQSAALSTRDQPPTPLMTTLAELKNSLEAGPIGNTLKNVDPLPEGTYRRVERVGEVASNPETAQRFLRFPGAQQIANDPKIIALRDDPEITKLVSQSRVFDLLQNQRVIDALNDPVLLARLKNFDLDRALDYALTKN
jgi:hypothetical protein